MQQSSTMRFFIVIIPFICAFILETMPLPAELVLWKPLWITLFLVYWNLNSSENANIPIAFIVGFIWDLTTGITLGVHPLALSIMSYFITIHSTRIKTLSLLQQSIIVMLCCLFVQVVIAFFALFLQGMIIFSWSIVTGSILTGLLWSWLYLLFKHLGISK